MNWRIRSRMAGSGRAFVMLSLRHVLPEAIAPWGNRRAAIIPCSNTARTCAWRSLDRREARSDGSGRVTITRTRPTAALAGAGARRDRAAEHAPNRGRGRRGLLDWRRARDGDAAGLLGRRRVGAHAVCV